MSDSTRNVCETTPDAEHGGDSRPLRNSLAVRAGEVAREVATYHAKTLEGAAAYLRAGAQLAEAKSECRHGEWLAFLDAAGVTPRTAQRMLRLHSSGLKADTVSSMGGITAALDSLAPPSPPEPPPNIEQVLQVWPRLNLADPRIRELAETFVVTFDVITTYALQGPIAPAVLRDLAMDDDVDDFEALASFAMKGDGKAREPSEVEMQSWMTACDELSRLHAEAEATAAPCRA